MIASYCKYSTCMSLIYPNAMAWNFVIFNVDVFSCRLCSILFVLLISQKLIFFLVEGKTCSDKVPSQHIRMFRVGLQIWSTHWHNSNSWDTNIIGITSELWLIFSTCYHLVNKQCLTRIRQLLSKSASKSYKAFT